MLKAICLDARRVYWGMALFLVMSIIGGIVGYDYYDEYQLAAIQPQPITKPEGKVSITINVNKRTLEVFSDGAFHKKYRVAVGKSETPTPLGEWNVVWKAYDWGTGFGTRWMGLNVPWGIYGIHGTNKPWSIGQFASHGCIRMRNKDVEELFEWVPIGTPVKIEGRKINVQRALKYQMNGSDVALLQMKLKEQGYYIGRADGIFGKATEEAVKSYQADHNFEVTGIVKDNMLNFLGI